MIRGDQAPATSPLPMLFDPLQGWPGGVGRATEGTDGLPLRMVEGVKRLRPELQRGVLRAKPWRCEILKQSHVPVVASGPGEHVSPHVSEHPRLPVGSELRQQWLRDREVPAIEIEILNLRARHHV